MLIPAAGLNRTEKVTIQLEYRTNVRYSGKMIDVKHSHLWEGRNVFRFRA
jgi:hypothetical protein